MYLGGSYSTGEFRPGSDYDVAVVIAREPTEADITRLRSLHETFAREDPESLLLEGDYLVRDTLIPEGTTEPAWWFRHGTLRGREPMMSADNVANLGRHGIAVYGPPADDVFPRVSAQQIRAAVREMMAEAPDRSTEFQAAGEILDVARSLRALETGEPTSRAAGLEWGLAHMDARWHEILRRAAEVRAGAQVAPDDERLRDALSDLRGALGLD